MLETRGGLLLPLFVTSVVVGSLVGVWLVAWLVWFGLVDWFGLVWLVGLVWFGWLVECSPCLRGQSVVLLFWFVVASGLSVVVVVAFLFLAFALIFAGVCVSWYGAHASQACPRLLQLMLQIG